MGWGREPPLGVLIESYGCFHFISCSIFHQKNSNEKGFNFTPAGHRPLPLPIQNPTSPSHKNAAPPPPRHLPVLTFRLSLLRRNVTSNVAEGFKIKLSLPPMTPSTPILSVRDRCRRRRRSRRKSRVSPAASSSKHISIEASTNPRGREGRRAHRGGGQCPGRRERGGRERGHAVE